MEAENTLAWSLLTYPGVQVSLKLAHYPRCTNPKSSLHITPASASLKQNLWLRLCVKQVRQMPCSPLKRSNAVYTSICLCCEQ